MGWGVGGRFRREGPRLHRWPTHIHARQRPTQYCEAIILQLKISKFTKKKKRASTKWQHRHFHRLLTPLLGRTGIIEGAPATEPLAHTTANEAEEDSVATAELWTKVSLTLMLQVDSAFRDLTGWGECDAQEVTQTVKNLPAMQESWVQSLNREDALEKGMATHSRILAWRIPRTEGSGGLQST